MISKEKQIHTKLNNYYKSHFRERITDEWYVNPDINIWKFKRDGKIIILTYDITTGKIKEKTTEGC